MTTTEFKPKQRQDRDVTTFTEFTGLRNDTTPERFTSNDLAVADNVIIDNARTLRRRAGATLVQALAAHTLWANGADVLAGCADKLLRLDEALHPTVLKTGLAGIPLSLARAGDNIYYSNGQDSGAVTAAGARSWGLEVPHVLATNVVGDLTPGRYLISATYLRSDGQESGAAQAELVEVELGESVMLTVPTSIDPDVVAARFYMSTPDEEVLYHVGDSAGAPFVPAAADIAAMNEPLLTQFMGPPPAGQLVAYFKGRMFVASGDVLYPSQPFAYELFDQRDYIQLDAPITMLAVVDDVSSSGLFIGTAKSTGVLVGDAPEDFKYAQRLDYGVVQGALAYVEGSLFMEGSAGARQLPMWLSSAGICVGMPSMDITNITRERYAFPAAATLGAAMYDPVSNQFVATTGNGNAIAMQTQTLTLTTFSSYDYGAFARAYGRNLAGSANGLFELVGDTDAGTPVIATVELATTDFGTSMLKAIDRLYVGYECAAPMNLEVTVDGGTSADYALPANQRDMDTQRVKTGRGLSGRYWGFTLTNPDGAAFALDTVDVKVNRLERRVNGRA